MDKLDFLLNGLINENRFYKGKMAIPKSQMAKKKLFDALCSVRPAGYNESVNEEWLQVQDSYLKEKFEESKKIVSCEDIKTVEKQFSIPVKPMYLQEKMKKTDAFKMFHSDKIALFQGDITTISADAIVNSAHHSLLGCNDLKQECIDRVIHQAAGIQLKNECSIIMKQQGYEEPNGFAKITKAYNLPCNYVIHTVGPVIQDGVVTEQDETELRSCYDSSLSLAEEKQLKTIAFCCISTGNARFPKKQAAAIAIQAADEFLDTSKYLEKVIFTVFSEEEYKIYEMLFKEYK